MHVCAGAAAVALVATAKDAAALQAVLRQPGHFDHEVRRCPRPRPRPPWLALSMQHVHCTCMCMHSCMHACMHAAVAML